MKSCSKEKVLGKDSLSRKEQCLLNRVIAYAHNSECTQRHAALVYRGGRILRIATNKYHNDPNIFPTDILNEVTEHIGIHAEVNAIRGLCPERVRGATIYVARVNSAGEPGLSRPCRRCAAYLKECGVRRVVYTDTIAA